MQKKQAGIYSLAIGLCQLPLLPPLGWMEALGMVHPALRVCLKFWEMLPLLENFDVFSHELERLNAVQGFLGKNWIPEIKSIPLKF